MSVTDAVSPSRAPAASLGLAPPARVAALDGLRGIAILLVLAMHYLTVVPGPREGGATYEFFQRIGSLGFSGVDLFFVLSGFLIGGILLDHRASPRLLPTFYARRFFRIVPPYALLLGSYFLCRALPGFSAVNRGTYFVSTVPTWSYFVMVQNVAMAWTRDIGSYWLGVTWSLAVEEQFYLVMPVLAQRLTPRLVGALCLAVIGASPLLRLQALDGAQNSLAAVFLLPTRADGLLWGVLCALLVRHPAATAFVRRCRPLLQAGITGLAVAFVVASLQRYAADSRPMVLFGYSLLSIFFAAILLEVVLFPVGRAARLLGAKPLAAVGVTSYFTYLFHTPIWYGLHWIFFRRPPLHYDWQAGAVTVLSVGVTLAAAWWSMRWFEGPLLRYGRKFSYT